MRTSYTLFFVAAACPLVISACEPVPSAPPDAGAEASVPEAGNPDGAVCTGAGASWDATPARTDDIAAGQTSSRPEAAFDAMGNAIAVWQQNDGTQSTVWAAERSPSGTWSAPERVDTAAMNANAGPPQLAVSANGSAVAVWDEYFGATGGKGDAVWSAVYTPGSGWGTAAQIFEVNTSGNLDPTVAVDSHGNAVAAWTEDVGASFPTPPFGQQVYAARYAPGSGWAAAVRVSSNGQGFAPMHLTQDTGHAHVSVDDTGDAIVVWNTNVGNLSANAKVMASRSTGGSSTWDAPVFLDNCAVGMCANSSAITPRVALDAAGNAYAVWQQQVAAASGIRPWGVRLAASSGSWSSPAENLDANLASIQTVSEPRLAIDPAGNALAVWQQTVNTGDKSRNAIVSAYYTGGAWKPAVGVDVTNPGAYNQRPAVAFDDAGNGFVVWDNQANEWASRFSATDGSFGADSQIHAGSSAGYSDIAVSHGSCPLALAVWNSGDGLGANTQGIFALAYH